MGHKRLIFLITTVLLIGFGISTTISMISLNRLIDENAMETSLMYANEVTDVVAANITEPITVGRSINNDFVHDVILDDSVSSLKRYELLGQYLSHLRSYFECDTAFIAVDSTREFITEHGYSYTLDAENLDNDWYDAFRNTGLDYQLNVDNDQANNNRITVYVNVRMQDDKGEFIGACGVGMTMSNLSQQMKEFEKKDGYSILLCDGNGTIQANSERARAGTYTAYTVKDEVSDEVKAMIDHYDRRQDYSYKKLSGNEFLVVKYLDVADWYMVIEYHGDETPELASVLLLNLAAFAMAFIVMLLVVTSVMGKMNKKTQEYKISAELDKMTGLLNRRAYEERLHELSRLDSLNRITVGIADVNGLKNTNDTLGHKAGDELIVAASKILNEVFGHFGKIFRIGGDEFAIIIDEVYPDEDYLVENMKHLSEEWKGERIDSVNIALGLANGEKYSHMSLNELIEFADRLMYEDKKIWHAKHPEL